MSLLRIRYHTGRSINRTTTEGKENIYEDELVFWEPPRFIVIGIFIAIIMHVACFVAAIRYLWS